MCDIEMPRMDGFQFLAEVKKDARLCSLPIILVTSATAAKTRAWLSLAGRYIVKQKFDHGYYYRP